MNRYVVHIKMYRYFNGTRQHNDEAPLTMSTAKWKHLSSRGHFGILQCCYVETGTSLNL